MSAQPEALWLARELDAYSIAPHHKQAAAELRRLHAQRDVLLEALKLARLMLHAHGERHAKIEAAIKARKEEKT